MKKYGKIIAIMLLGLFLVGCASNQCWNTKTNKSNKLYKKGSWR